MLIGGISISNPALAPFHPVLVSTSASSATTALADPARGSKPANAQTPDETKTATSNHAASSSSAQTGVSAAVVASEELVLGYTTKVGGQTYSASVDLGDGQYTASVSELVGASASASTEQDAESNLSLRIDALV